MKNTYLIEKDTFFRASPRVLSEKVQEIKTEASEVEWWMDQTDNTESLQILDSFKEAKTEILL